MQSRTVWFLTVTLYVAKLTVYTWRCMLPAFVPFFSEITGESVHAIAAVIAWPSVLCTIVNPLYGIFSCYARHSTLFIACALLLAVILLTLLLTTSFPLFATVIIVSGIIPGIVYPALQCWLSTVFPVERMLMVTLASQCAWGTANLIGLPITGILMGFWWRLPFAVLLVMCCVTITVSVFLLRPCELRAEHNALLKPKQPTFKSRLHDLSQLFLHIVPQCAMLTGICSAFVETSMLTVFGLWLHSGLNYSVSQVGDFLFFVSVPLVIGEVLNVILTGLKVDPITQLRLYTVVGVLVSVSFPFFGQIPFGVALAMIAVWYAMNEGRMNTLVGVASQAVEAGVPGCALSESAVFASDTVGVFLGTYTAPILWNLGLFTWGLINLAVMGGVLLGVFVGLRHANLTPIHIALRNAQGDKGEQQGLLTGVVVGQSPQKEVQNPLVNTSQDGKAVVESNVDAN
eukprot:TRINITY_DN75095_c0_g1_i1.p1 TRINITY_DN75095_c0_g1~~TRINITY_DN75095_c0_g1_i1.p1  ORF type:complete len:458 (+),score=-6.05 TRINITY_DN75095_c0_g1_i1:30-1403(+)